MELSRHDLPPVVIGVPFLYEAGPGTWVVAKCPAAAAQLGGWIVWLYWTGVDSDAAGQPEWVAHIDERVAQFDTAGQGRIALAKATPAQPAQPAA